MELILNSMWKVKQAVSVKIWIKLHPESLKTKLFRKSLLLSLTKGKEKVVTNEIKDVLKNF